MTAVSLTTLRARARTRADMPVSGFIADSAGGGIDDWINEGIQILHEKLVQAYGSNYVATSTTLTTTSNGVIALPANFFALLGASLSINGQNVTLRPFAQSERNTYVGAGLQWIGTPESAPRYQLFGSNIRLLPAPAAGLSLVLEYNPIATVLVAGGDTVDFPNGWERYVVVYTAIQMRMKQESSVTELNNVLEAMNAQLKEMADLRDAGAPAVAADVVPDWGL